MTKRRVRPDGSIVYTEETNRTIFRRGFRQVLMDSTRVLAMVLGLVAAFSILSYLIWVW